MVVALVPAVLIGLLNGVGVAVFRVHPLIMTLGTGLIGIGCLQVYQRGVIATGSVVPPFLEWLGTGRTWGLPNALCLFVPFAVLIIYAQGRFGFGRFSMPWARTRRRRGCRACGLGRCFWRCMSFRR